MSDTPKFEVIDRRKLKAEEERETAHAPSAPPEPEAEQQTGPRLVETQSRPDQVAKEAVKPVEPEEQAELPPPPTAEESRQQKSAYDASAQRLEDLVRAQNPAVGAQPPVAFEHLVQQLYLSAMIQMGAGAPEGQRPRVDILGARQTIDLLGVLAEKTRGNLTESENGTLQTALFEARMAFLELTNMITMQGMHVPPPPPNTKP